MSRVRIVKEDGPPTPYFWSEGDGSAVTRKRVYRETSRGVTRMRGVRFDSVKKADAPARRRRIRRVAGVVAVPS